MQRVIGGKTGGTERPAANARIGEQGGAERAAADSLRHVPGADKIARREYAVGEDDRHAVGEQQHFACPGVAPRWQADQVPFVDTRQGAGFAQRGVDLDLVADDAAHLGEHGLFLPDGDELSSDHGEHEAAALLKWAAADARAGDTEAEVERVEAERRSAAVASFRSVMSVMVPIIVDGEPLSFQIAVPEAAQKRQAC